MNTWGVKPDPSARAEELAEEGFLSHNEPLQVAADPREVSDPSQKRVESIPATPSAAGPLPELPKTAYPEGSVELDVQKINETVFEEAARLINGNRNGAYGDATPAFNGYAKGAQVIFDNPNITGKQVALFMAWMKLCRELNRHQRDNIVDMMGYAGLAYQIETGEK